MLLNETSVNFNLHRMANEMEIFPRKRDNSIGLEYSHFSLLIRAYFFPMTQYFQVGQGFLNIESSR
jgi:hypothetical protein